MDTDRGNCLCQRSISQINCVFSLNCNHFMCCNCFKKYCIKVVLPDGSTQYIERLYEPLFVNNGSPLCKNN